MLDEKICRLCFKKACRDRTPFDEWYTKENERRWKNEAMVFCPKAIGMIYKLFDGPENCPYKLEHLLQDQYFEESPC